jgi:transcriptional regulator with XRE-family HTH domain
MKIGEYIKEIRISKGFTQTELSEKSGIAVRTIQRIENAEVTPSIYSLNAIGTALDVKLNEVPIGGNDEKFEFKIVISNFNNLFVDIKTLIKRNMKTLLVLITVTFGFLSFKDLKSFFVNLVNDPFLELELLSTASLFLF